MFGTRWNAILKTSEVSLTCDGNKGVFGEDAPLFWETRLVTPFHELEFKHWPWAAGDALLTYWTKESCDLGGKDIQSICIPCVARDGGLMRAQGSPLQGKWLLDASGCARNEATSWVWDGPWGTLCTRTMAPWRMGVAGETLSLNKGRWPWRLCVGIRSEPQQPGSYLGLRERSP